LITVGGTGDFWLLPDNITGSVNAGRLVFFFTGRRGCAPPPPAPCDSYWEWDEPGPQSPDRVDGHSADGHVPVGWAGHPLTPIDPANTETSETPRP